MKPGLMGVRVDRFHRAQEELLCTVSAANDASMWDDADLNYVESAASRALVLSAARRRRQHSDRPASRPRIGEQLRAQPATRPTSMEARTARWLRRVNRATGPNLPPLKSEDRTQ